MRKALGMIEAIGLTTAITSLDAACKAADVTLVGYDKVIGVDKAISVTIHVVGEVAAVNAAIEAGVMAGSKVGKVMAYRTIARPDEEIDFLINKFKENLKEREKNQKDNITKDKENINLNKEE